MVIKAYFSITKIKARKNSILTQDYTSVQALR